MAVLAIELSSLELVKFTGWAERICSFEISNMNNQISQDLSWDDAPSLRSHFNHTLKYLELHFRTASEQSCDFVALQISSRSEKTGDEYCDSTKLSISVIIFQVRVPSLEWLFHCHRVSQCPVYLMRSLLLFPKYLGAVERWCSMADWFLTAEMGQSE